MSTNKNILLLGSGLMAETVVDYLLKRPENVMVIASNILAEAKKLAEGRKNCSAAEVNVTKAAELTPLVAAADIVISYVPWTMHMYIAKVCLAQKKHLITASYIQPELKALNDQVEKAGLTFLNEVGVDPGIDHIATMKVVDECAEKQEKILEYESFCGGLPSPEFCDNPIGYKFSWSPVGALLSLQNDAIFLENGAVRHVKSQDLLYTAEKKVINMALNLEGYANRDSVKYQDLYRLHDCKKLVRGTLRYFGFSMVLNSMKELNLLDKETKVPISGSWFDLLCHQVKDVSDIDHTVKKTVLSLNLPSDTAQLACRMLTKTFQNHNYKTATKEEIETKTKIILSAYIDLHFFNKDIKVDPSQTYIQNTVNILEKSCNLSPGETDMIVMQHKFKIQKKNGEFYRKKSSMIVIGQKNSFSAMAITVGTPTAVAAQLVLDGTIKRKGVLMPNTKDVYLPLFYELEKLGLYCKESDEASEEPKPKL